MHDDSKITEGRLRRALAQRIRPAETLSRIPLAVTALHLPGEPVPVSDIDPAGFGPIAVGDPWGHPWGTTWFSVGGSLDSVGEAERTTTEVQVDIGFSGAMAGFQAEAAVYVDGRIRCGVHPRRRAIPLDVVAVGGTRPASDRIEFLLEAAANPDFSAGFAANRFGDPRTAGQAPLYTFRGVDLVTYDAEVRELVRELSTLKDLIGVLDRGSPRRRRLTAIVSRALGTIDSGDVPVSAPAAREVLAEGLDLGAAPDAHHLVAVGHAHIDTAWLWPLRETRRKCARTFANQVQLMEDHPEHTFVCSQAAQYEFVREDHPELFEQIRHRVDEGRWVPVGGMWVEADMNLPSGESIVRQLVVGQRYFRQHFGITCSEVWLPDVFGYPGGLPQIFRQAGCTRFLTQKLSWNKQNRFPHHSFTWEGIDGSEILAHFPPVETYNSELTPRELSFASANFADHEWSDLSLLPFGYGDGGGGPSADMLERARLLGDLAGLPHLTIGTPDGFFSELEREIERPRTPRWRGELYFEMHRGTLTSQARTKVGNRRCEVLLREVELWAATLHDVRHRAELEELWKRVLTQQFHDILPGSSIAWVHQDTEREHAEIAERLESMLAELLAEVPGDGPLLINSATHPRHEVVSSPVAPDGDTPVQDLADGAVAFMTETPGMGVAALQGLEPTGRVEASSTRLSNQVLSVTFDASGSVTSIVDERAGRELVPPGRTCANVQIAADEPVEFDAWDIEDWTIASSADLPPAERVEVIDNGPLLASLRVTRTFGSSRLTQTFTLGADSPRLDIRVEVDWREDEKYLSIDFPLAVHSEVARCETQFGHVARPTHRSTSWDAAKFEVCAHRWVDLAEPGFGVAILNDGRYGHSIQDGGVRVSLLRAPMYPDPSADRGTHSVTVSVLPHQGDLGEVVTQAENLNTPLRVRTAHGPTDGDQGLPAPVISCDDRRVAVSAVKAADDGSGDLVVRLWEATGDRVRTRLGCTLPIRSVKRCNLLEEPVADRHPVCDGSAVDLELRPFELVTLRVTYTDGPHA